MFLDKERAIQNGLWEGRGEEAMLLGSKCNNCTELFFPRKKNKFCPHCQNSSIEDTILTTVGTIKTFTTVNQEPAGGFYHGPVPFSYGIVVLPEGIVIETLFSESESTPLKIGMKVELVIDKLYQEEDEENILTYKFKPL